MAIYIPNYIKQHLDYKSNERVTHEDYNNILNLLVTASDYNTGILNAIANDTETKLVINSVNAEHAEIADVAHNSEALSSATLSRKVTTTLEDNDEHIPSSKQVKDYVDSIQTANSNTFGTLTTRLNNNDACDVAQDNRLANIDLINNQYGNRISLLENRVAVNESAITEIRGTDLSQDATLSIHDQRITNLELGEVPADVLNTLMTKGGYAVNTGQVDEHGQPIYSPDTVKKAQTSLNLLVNDEALPASSFALASTVTALTNSSFVTRGALSNPNTTYYTVGELKLLKHGSYEVSGVNSTALNTGGVAGTLRLYPCGNGLSLEYEIQTGEKAGRFLTMFIAQSTLDNTGVNTLPWYDEAERFNTAETDITTLQTNRLTVDNLIAGNDVSIVKDNNNSTFNYTGPKIVISTTQPTSDPNRQTLWIAL